MPVMKLSTEQELSRARMYGLLGKLYDAPPSPDLLRELRKTGFYESDTRQGSITDDSAELSVEFTRLFLGPGPHVAPFASVYRRDDTRSGQLWGSTTAEVKRFMEHYGLSLNNPGAIPDHIAILFEFMERVIRTKLDMCGSTTVRSNREEAIKQAEEVEKTFFNSYLGEWTDLFFAAVEKASPHPFYRSLVQHTKDFLAEEKEYFMT
ncbi:MAG: hypothetical protein D6800_03850 [Candidatus Zixiibacteriota bacterium]|nr:MAG: hypothetical protein D6800_03850 [candidate division Zixibacteria bacterium]